MESMPIEELRNSIHDVLTAEFPRERLQQHVEGRFEGSEAMRRVAAELGWFSLLVPEALGGLGLQLTETSVLYEEFGRVLAPSQLLPSMLAIHALLLAGTEAQRAAYLERLTRGDLQGAVDVAPDTTLRIVGDSRGYEVSGSVKALFQEDAASLLLLTAHDANQTPHWLLLEPSTVSRAHRLPFADRTRIVCSLEFDNLRIDSRSVLQPTREAVQTLRTHAALAIACDALGGARAVLELTLEYLRTRRQFDRVIGSFQALKHRAANHKIALESARALLARVLRSQDTDARHMQLVYLAKAYACDTFAGIAADCIQLHGGIGFTWEHPCHWYLRRAKLNQMLFGSSIWCLDRAAAIPSASAQGEVRHG